MSKWLMLVVAALMAHGVDAQDFVPSILVDHTAGAPPLVVTIDMCATSGRELRFGWDYDGDGIDDQHGPCRRTLTLQEPGLHAIRVSVWEAVGTDRGRREETIWANVVADRGSNCTAQPFYGFALQADSHDPNWTIITATPMWGHEHGLTGPLSPVPTECRGFLEPATWFEDIRRQPDPGRFPAGHEGHVDPTDRYRYYIRPTTSGEVRLCSLANGICGDWNGLPF